MPGSLAARDISKSFAAARSSTGSRWSSRRATGSGSSARTGSANRPCSRCSPGSSQPDAGQVIRSGAVGYLPQEPDADRRRDGARLPRPPDRRRRGRNGDGWARRTARARSRSSRAPTRRRSTASSRSAARTSSRARRAVLADVGLGPQTEQAMATLSGGEAAKAALAAILLARFDVFLLDEPTNNLDFAGLELLERFLDSLAAGVVLVSHDRAFLDRVVTRVVEIEAETRKVHEYAGTWSEYEAARERARAQHERDYGGYVERAGPLQRAAHRPAPRPGTGARNASRRVDGRRTRLRGKVQQAKNHLERLEEVEKPWSPWQLRLDLPPAPKAALIASSTRRRRRARLRSRSGRFARAALGRPACDRRAERLRQDDPDRRAARRAAARAQGHAGSARRSSSAS